ncbi:MAG: putative metal-binding motif-containing protein [Myxococcota bacterium]
MRRWISLALLGLISCDPAEPRECKEEEEVFVFVDSDEDGWGSEPIGYRCDVSPGEALNSLDCDDTRADVNPDAEDVCDETDNNCDGRIDEGTLNRAYFADLDGDGFGDAENEIVTCLDPPADYVSNPNDCDDESDERFPGNPEICNNGIDEDCSGIADDIIEICTDSIDNDCDGFQDCADVDCSPTPFCCSDVALASVVPTSYFGTTFGQGDDRDPGCSFSFATDVAHRFVAPETGTYVFDTFGSSFDTVLALYDTCNGASIACNDDAGGGSQSELTLSMTAGEVILISVDGIFSSSGNYTLNVDRQ